MNWRQSIEQVFYEHYVGLLTDGDVAGIFGVPEHLVAQSMRPRLLQVELRHEWRHIPGDTRSLPAPNAIQIGPTDI